MIWFCTAAARLTETSFRKQGVGGVSQSQNTLNCIRFRCWKQPQPSAEMSRRMQDRIPHTEQQVGLQAPLEDAAMRQVCLPSPRPRTSGGQVPHASAPAKLQESLGWGIRGKAEWFISEYCSCYRKKEMLNNAWWLQSNFPRARCKQWKRSLESHRFWPPGTHQDGEEASHWTWNRILMFPSGLYF